MLGLFQVSKNPQKQLSLGECGGVAVLLDMCDPIHSTEAPLLVPVLWTLRNCLHGNDPNKDRFLRAGGLETLTKARNPKQAEIFKTLVLLPSAIKETLLSQGSAGLRRTKK